MKTKEELQAEADALANESVLVATNQGTYGAAEACRIVGSGDPQFADCNVYETVGQPRKSDGEVIAQHNGVGRMIIGRKAVNEKRARLTELRRQIASM